MSQSSHIAIAVLAAGASTRMGCPKQLLKWGEKSLIQHAIHTSKNTLAMEVIVVLGANSEDITFEINTEAVTVIVNNEWQQGLGKSIASAAHFVLDSKEKVDGLLIVLVDQPFVTSDYLNEMLKTFNPNKKEIIATSYSKEKIGVPTLFDKTYFRELSQLSGDDGAKGIIKTHKDLVKVITPNFKNIDIDTQADYKILYNLSDN
ncbi:nucleotidyltransferase family protein [Hyunsoonleella sp. SJ7]|uniref:Nucleotidyltransferase family protein n=1 Tax=Hyunsoonleella aquatilis TaxID=2762758 RepID=A0A923HAP0_9FLAO|nr:nucleotidyltransferase family protein [Hyunsoonleella aquatilis]MBC3759940.1 nucleotidyltransferase family protein [Hyunsoonleella aquatilis]